jgi:hypothetical protein
MREEDDEDQRNEHACGHAGRRQVAASEFESHHDVGGNADHEARRHEREETAQAEMDAAQEIPSGASLNPSRPSGKH